MNDEPDKAIISPISDKLVQAWIDITNEMMDTFHVDLKRQAPGNSARTAYVAVLNAIPTFAEQVCFNASKNNAPHLMLSLGVDVLSRALSHSVAKERVRNEQVSIVERATTQGVTLDDLIARFKEAPDDNDTPDGDDRGPA